MNQWAFTSAAGARLLLIVFYAGLLFAVEWLTDGENRLQRLFQAPWFVQGGLVPVPDHDDLRSSTRARANEFIYFQF